MRIRAVVLLLSGLLLFTSTVLECTVFLAGTSAAQLLSSSPQRKRRANYFLEEMLPGNLERECYEEACSQEEAAEIFQSREKTLEFWYRYTNLNPCLYNPCLNGGLCTVERDAFLCLCPPQYDGKTCETEVAECHYRNGGCLQFCTEQTGGRRGGVQCSCAEGYGLDPDGYGCTKTMEFPCGRKLNEAFYRARSLLDYSETEETSTNGSMDSSLMVDNATMLDPSSNMVDPASSNMVDPGSNMVDPSSNMVDPSSNMVDPSSNNASWPNATGEETNSWRGEEEVGGGEGGGGGGGGEGEGGDDLTPRIIGGSLEKLGGSPWQVLVHRSDGHGFCGGTLVSDRWIVSAAHCFEETPDHVTIGDYDKRRPDPGEQRIPVKSVVVHPHFHQFTFDSDVALLFLSRAVVRGPTALPACLPNAQLAKYLVKDDTTGLVTGWGAMHYLGRSSRFLRKVALPVVSQKSCVQSTEQVITDNMFCAGYLQTERDACSGDSGGPFVVHYRGTWFLTGVVSWGERCAATGKYGVYTRLGNYLGWIRDTMEREEERERLEEKEKEKEETKWTARATGRS